MMGFITAPLLFITMAAGLQHAQVPATPQECHETNACTQRVLYHPNTDKLLTRDLVYRPKTDKLVVMHPLYRPQKDKLRISSIEDDNFSGRSHGSRVIYE